MTIEFFRLGMGECVNFNALLLMVSPDTLMVRLRPCCIASLLIIEDDGTLLLLMLLLLPSPTAAPECRQRTRAPKSFSSCRTAETAGISSGEGHSSLLLSLLLLLFSPFCDLRQKKERDSRERATEVKLEVW